MTQPVDLEALAAAHAASTQSSWAVNPFRAQVDCADLDEDGDPLPVLQLLWPTKYRSEAETEANAHFIALAHNAMPAILAELRQLRAENERLTRQLSEARHGTSGPMIP